MASICFARSCVLPASSAARSALVVVVVVVVVVAVVVAVVVVEVVVVVVVVVVVAVVVCRGAAFNARTAGFSAETFPAKIFRGQIRNKPRKFRTLGTRS